MRTMWASFSDQYCYRVRSISAFKHHTLRLVPTKHKGLFLLMGFLQDSSVRKGQKRNDTLLTQSVRFARPCWEIKDAMHYISRNKFRFDRSKRGF